MAHFCGEIDEEHIERYGHKNNLSAFKRFTLCPTFNIFTARIGSDVLASQSQTNVEVTKEEDWNTLLRMEEEYIENICAQIVAFRPDIVITEKGVSDLAQHFLMKANITVSSTSEAHAAAQWDSAPSFYCLLF